MTTVFRPGGLARDPLYFYHLGTHPGIILVSIQKNGCTAQKEWLLRAEGVPLRGDSHTLAFERLSLLTRPADVRARALAELPLIVFLRDPVLRIASAFRDKLLSPLNFPSATAIEGAATRRGTPIVRDRTVPFPSMGAGARFAGCARVDYERGLSFREFVEYVAATPDLGLDPHFRPQAWFVRPAIERARAANAPRTIVAPMDRLGEILAEVGRPLGLAPPAAQRPRSDELTPSAEDLSAVPSGELRASGRKPRTSELYTGELIGLVLRRFPADADLWGRLGQPPAADALLRASNAAAA